MVTPRQRSFATPLEWMKPQTSGAWRPWRLPASLLARTRYVLLLLAIVTSAGLAPFVLRDPAVPMAARIAALSGLATLLAAWIVAYRTRRHRGVSLVFEGPALFAVCSGVGAPQLAVGLVSAAIFYSAMFEELRVARAAGLVYSASFVGAVALTSHPRAMPVWSPATISPLIQFAVLGGLLFSMGRMIERIEREQERAAALRGLGEALGAAKSVEEVIDAWLSASMTLGAPAGATGAAALVADADAWRVSGARAGLVSALGKSAPQGSAAAPETSDYELERADVEALERALELSERAAHVYRFAAKGAGDGVGAAALLVASSAPLPEETCEQLSAATHHANVALGLERSRTAMMRAERLAAIGQLAASMAHELRNPLAAIRGAATYLKRSAQGGAAKGGDGGGGRAVQFLEIIEREVSASNRIITDLLDFARNRPPLRSSTVLRDLVEEVRQVVPLAGTRLVNAVPAELPPHGVDRDQIRQVIVNLVQNAVEAAAPEHEGEVVVRARGAGQLPLTIEVEDNGIGMPPDVAARAFEPLYTTKNKGTGLGLSIVGKIVLAHGGSVRVDTKPGRGTKFVLELPPDAAPPERPSLPAPGALQA